jgi:hypothetical protein
MALRIRFRFDGKCGRHPRYDPKRDGRPQHGNCEGCESLYVIALYVRIAKRRADKAEGIVVRSPVQSEGELSLDESAQAPGAESPDG